MKSKKPFYEHEKSTRKLTFKYEGYKNNNGPNNFFFATLEVTVDTKFKQKGL